MNFSPSIQSAINYLKILESKKKLTKIEKQDIISVRASISQHIGVSHGSKEERNQEDDKQEDS